MKSIRDINDLKVNLDNYVSYSIRESLGIIVLSFSEKEIVIGAMNPNYIKVLEFVNNLESEIKIKVKTKQISSDEWEQKNISHDKSIQFSTDSIIQTQNEDSDLISKSLTKLGSGLQLLLVKISMFLLLLFKNFFVIFVTILCPV